MEAAPVYLQKSLVEDDVREADSDYLDCREELHREEMNEKLRAAHYADEEDEEDDDSGEDETLRNSHDSSSSGGQFINEDDPSEQSHCSMESLPERQQSRYYGHPLGVEELEMQEYQVQQYKASLQEAFMHEFRFQGQWSHHESRVRAKLLVAEGYFKEKDHLRHQEEHLYECELLTSEPRPQRRFRAHHKFRDAGFLANKAEVLEMPDLHKKVVAERQVTLKPRWARIMAHVENDMREGDNFANVIKNLSTMRIFLEGQQSMSYSVDPLERQRRCYLSQSVIQAIAARNDGLFLKDAHPRGEPLNL
eukprot:TRINITY_DN9160_c0_g1_i1.p1 TRINITY_DN9160_c0_g1~~TRINITY_DN9160_c0_g1_i1.p1  ORF type:complete len:307 (+),score=148.64 TRINITY_DN9160_c0_g1_i1:323-1243(+)